jgi:hypothetical protein
MRLMIEFKRIEVEEKIASRFIRRKEEMGESNRSRVEFPQDYGGDSGL